MSQDIRKYFEVSGTPKCAPMFKKCVIVEKEDETPLKQSNNLIHTQPMPQIVNQYTPDKESITYEAFTDGSTLGNGGRNAIGGIGVYFPDDLKLKNVSLNYAKFVIENPSLELKGATNNITELLGISIAIQLLTAKFKKDHPIDDITKLRIILYSDSEYSINCISKWAPAWERNGWKKKGGKKADRDIKNVELIKKLYKTYTSQRIKFVHVNSHLKEPSNRNSVEWRLWYGNDMADKLAKQGANDR
tara:strand:+ start:248 stop:985 length:738 start_codon:yes stop_codon:yes gene_type:complete